MSWFPWLLTRWPSSALYLLLISVGDRQTGLEVVQAVQCTQWAATSSKSNFQDGDMVIGGLFNLYYTPSAVEQGFTKLPHYKPCTGLDLMSLKNTYAMVFALEEINRNSTLLPGVKLGYRLLDSCFNSLWALQSALSLIGGDAHSCNSTASSSAAYDQPGEKAGGQSVPLLIGAASSTTTLILSRILGPLSVPLISYLASCPCLSDRYKFPNVFRTIPSDLYQARAMAQLAIRFRWTWIGAVVINNDYGNLAIQTFQKETQGKGVCLEFIETVGRETILIDARRAALKIQASTAKVILIFCWYTDVKKVFLELAKIHVTDRQFLASEAWSTSDEILKDLAISKVASGVLGVAIRSSKIPGFENYLRSLHPTRRPDDDFLREFWEMEFGCSPGATQSQAVPLSSYLSPLKKLNNRLNVSASSLSNKSLMKASLPPCSGRESLEEVQNHFTDTSQLRVAYNVYLAVYAAAHALHSLLSCPNRDSSSGRNSSCSSSKQIKPFELLQSLNKVNVTTPQGEMFYFEGADIPAKYDLVNWQNTPEGSLKLVLIGRVDGFDINLNDCIHVLVLLALHSEAVLSRIAAPGGQSAGAQAGITDGSNSDLYTVGHTRVIRMSYTASCPCLSDRLQYPNFFRTMPSDIYQARAIAQIAIRLNWTWIGAVIANNDYGHVAIKVFQEETQGAGVCLAFIETVQRETIVMDARRAALTIQASTAKVILIFTWYTDVRELFLQLANINVTDKQFLASEAWSTSGNLLQDPITSKSWGLTTLYEFTVSHRPVVSESFTSTVQRQRVPGRTHALHSLLSCPNRDSSPGNISSTCSSPKQIKPIEVLHHLNNLNFTTPQGEMFYFQEGNTPAKYDLVNWQNTPEGSLK
ncbi:hypothetical protein KUCAC02_005116 [Chaenocephalus aceratus]|uniref:Uncharacterized protein n=1 Tax=Chaenocephalus aceratus TaxID=36190 RepID=A0ACB9WNB6_CHAAC|nr:hypothetical protein KUCAC02_005116 [Chaenocephalus aceratus]